MMVVTITIVIAVNSMVTIVVMYGGSESVVVIPVRSEVLPGSQSGGTKDDAVGC